ncbi:MAG: LD-carboxypeptidase [Bdellovibrionaceae bacterium]|nr:LD-carboxypeptidase [Bdellovibrionales bacterium]MCB9083885.1 LD-carboxypeptidase [Pseudobdellovibrionaceae bacterium]
MTRSLFRRKPKMISWRPLVEGDVVDLIAPGFAPTKGEIRGAVAFLRSWGLKPRVPPGLLGADVLCSNSDKKRFQFLKRALLAKDSRAIWCLRGGYGANRLLPDLNSLRRPAQSKVLIGYSDVTTLHLFLNHKWGWNTIHGPLLDRFGQGVGRPRDKREMKALLFGDKPILEFSELRPLNTKASRQQTLRAPITGGNLTTWASAIGTPWEGVPRGKILFFEDIGEQGRKVDRMLVQMDQAGHLKGVKAMIFGEFIGGAQSNGRYLWREVIRRFADEAPFPVFDHFPAGHGPAQRPIPFGPRAELQMGKEPHLRVGSGFLS